MTLIPQDQPKSAEKSPKGFTGSPRTRDSILVESGTNELEILIFLLGDQRFGVNVAKVREVITPVPVVRAPEQPEFVKGMFDLRGRVLPLVDLMGFMEIEPTGDSAERHVVVTEFHGKQIGFEVQDVDTIYRMTWRDVRQVPKAASTGNRSVTGMVEVGEDLVMMLDFESISDRLDGGMILTEQQHAEELVAARRGVRVVFAEDSDFFRKRFASYLRNAGYESIDEFDNGQSALDHLKAVAKDPALRPDIIVSDIEMPQVDGLYLCRCVKESSALKDIPVLLFSSLVNEHTIHRGDSVGADAQLAKPEQEEVLSTIDLLLGFVVDENAPASEEDRTGDLRSAA